MKTICPECGVALAEGQFFCPACGANMGGDLLIGLTLDGKFRIDSLLSKSGLGKRYKATHIKLGRTICVLVLRKELTADPVVAQRMQEQLMAAAQINHPNLACIYGFGTTPAHELYVAEEHIVGPSLHQILRQDGPLDVTRTIHLNRQICSALESAHQSGILHRNLCPSNLILLQDGNGEQVKIFDLGIGVLCDIGNDNANYVSPERIKGQPLDPRADIYSLGAMLYEMLAGRPPFDSPSPEAILVRQIMEHPPLPHEIRLDIPLRVERVVMRALAKDRTVRQPSAAELVDELEEAVTPAPAGAIPPLTGEVLGGRYETRDRIGTGGLGSVHRGIDRATGRQIAIKILRGDFVDEAAVNLIKHEAEVLASLTHPNIVSFYGSGLAYDGSPYIIMEYVGGYTLDELLKKQGPLPPERTREIATQVCQALQTAHEKGILHRDLKPSNIFLRENPNHTIAVKVGDWGLASIRQGDEQQPTGTGALVGTIAYMSPEQIQGKELDARSDIYSLGVILYEMLTGRLPFSGESIAQIVTKILCEAPRSPRTRNRFIGPGLDYVVLRALEKDPNRRPSSAKQLNYELNTDPLGGGEPRGICELCGKPRPLLPAEIRPGYALSPPASVPSPTLRSWQIPTRIVLVGLLGFLLLLLVISQTVLSAEKSRLFLETLFTAIAVVLAFILLFVLVRKRRAREREYPAEEELETLLAPEEPTLVTETVAPLSETVTGEISIPEEPTEQAGITPTQRVESQPITVQESGLPGRIGRYRVSGKLGEGGMGVVYKAEDEENKRPVAVKVIGPSIAKDPQAEALFRREAQMALSVRHPNVVETYEFGMAEDALYFIAMEFVPGQKLRDVIDREVPFDLNRTINITQQIAEGLEVAHSQGIIHRDLKPENIMLCQTPEKTDFVKVLDFGLAKKPEYDLTQPGTIRGTLRYMSPEHILEEPVDARADVYSLGLIVYEMLSGRFPFVKWADKLKEDPILLTRIRDDLDLPSGVEAAVMRALAKNRELRTSSALEFARELEQGALGQSSVA